MKCYLFLVALLASLSASAASVTYTTSGFEVTTPDFLGVVYPNALQDGVGNYLFRPSELSRCGSTGQTCTQAGFVIFLDSGTPVVQPYIQVLVPNTFGMTVYEPLGYLVGANLNAVGDYSKPG